MPGENHLTWSGVKVVDPQSFLQTSNFQREITDRFDQFVVVFSNRELGRLVRAIDEDGQD